MFAGSLKTRLLTLALLLVVPTFVLLLLGNFRQQKAAKELASERATTTARLAAGNLSCYVREGRQQLATMTQFPVALSSDRALVEKGLKSMRRLQPDFSDFGLVELDGTVFAHCLGSNVSRVVSPSLVKKTLAARDFSIGAFSADSNGPPTLQFACPVLDPNGRLARVMYASLTPTLLTQVVASVTVPEGGAATLFNAEGVVLARSADAEQWLGKDLRADPLVKKSFEVREGAFESPGLDGITRVYAVGAIYDREKPVLYMTVGIPRQEFFATADAEFIGGFIFLVFFFAILLSIGWLYSDRVFVRPIGVLGTTADRIMSGDLKARTGLPAQRTELHRLARKFDEMAASLEKRQNELEQASLAIKKQNAELEERVSERTSALESLNKELEAFSYSVSHDLRAPLRHMDGFAQMLLRDPKLQSDPQTRRRLGIITDAAKQMGALIDDLLSFSRMGRQAMSLGQVNTAEMVRALVAEAAADEPERNIEWKIEDLPQVAGDSSLLRQVWVNLISNAVKYSRERNPAVIRIFSQTTETEVIFSVQDNGAGFDMKYVDKLFGVFQRLHQPDQFEGTGIGLANVRRIVARHGGRTWAEGKVDEGATISFSLPRTKPPGPPQ